MDVCLRVDLIEIYPASRQRALALGKMSARQQQILRFVRDGRRRPQVVRGARHDLVDRGTTGVDLEVMFEGGKDRRNCESLK